MNKKLFCLFVSSAAAGSLVFLAGCESEMKSSYKASPEQENLASSLASQGTPGAFQIIKQPEDQLVQVGSQAVFKVHAVSPPLEYQWIFNGVEIYGATNSIYEISNVQFTNVGAYQVKVKKGHMLTNSEQAFMSVYVLVGCGGTLQTPIGNYKPITSYTCDGGVFKHGYSPTNSPTTPALFYGPFASPQTGPFTNTCGCTNLTIDTFSTDNGTADTGIRLLPNWLSLTDTCCNDNAPPGSGQTDPKQSRCFMIPLSTAPGNPAQVRNSYRLQLLYKDNPGPPTSGVITFHWQYQ